MTATPQLKNPTVRRLGAHARLGFGAAPVGNLYRQTSDAEARGALQAAWSDGIRYFDTAPHYGLGLSERRVGEFLSQRPREDFLVSTKVGRLLRPAQPPREWDDEGFAVPGDVHRVRDYSPAGVRASIEESLERMDLDRIDIVYIHDPDDYWREALEGAVPELCRLRDEGVIGAWGAGMNQAEMLTRFVAETDIDLVMLAGRYTLLEQGGRDALLPACAAAGVGVVNVGVFNSGILANADPRAQAKYNYDEAPRPIVERAEALARLAQECDTSLPAAAVQFSLRDPAVTNVTLGMRTAAQVDRNIELFEQPVPEEFWTRAVDQGLLAHDPADRA